MKRFWLAHWGIDDLFALLFGGVVGVSLLLGYASWKQTRASGNVSFGLTILALPECRDDQDNDGDGLVDYPYDPECDEADDRSESPDPTPTPTATPTPSSSSSSDGSSSTGSSSSSEAIPSPTPLPTPSVRQSQPFLSLLRPEEKELHSASSPGKLDSAAGSSLASETQTEGWIPSLIQGVRSFFVQTATWITSAAVTVQNVILSLQAFFWQGITRFWSSLRFGRS